MATPDEVIPISFNALAQYRLVMDYIAESFLISHFNVVTRSGTSHSRNKPASSSWNTKRSRPRPQT